MFASFPWGFLFSKSIVGGSVAKAREARESMIILIQISCKAVRGDSPMMQDPTNATAKATMFVDTWN